MNFLDLLRAGYTDYVLNDAAYDYMRNQGLPAATIARLKAEPETRFSDQTAWQAHLDRLGFNALKVTPEPITRSDIGRDCRDAFLSLAKTCDKLGIAVWDYLGSRLKVAAHAIIEPLDHYVRARLRPA